jgi:fructose transport system substrate-binding protein
LTAAASLTFAACGGGGSTGSPEARLPVVVAVAVEKSRHLDHQGQQQPVLDLHAKERRRGGREGRDNLTKAAGAKDGDEDGQVKAIEAAVARGDKGILISPNGPGVNSAIENARNSGLYVIALGHGAGPA